MLRSLWQQERIAGCINKLSGKLISSRKGAEAQKEELGVFAPLREILWQLFSVPESLSFLIVVMLYPIIMLKSLASIFVSPPKK
ncbi:MAG: hypothetical protein KC445_00410 [Anaerolineales bacterium]|nr:hypothetical protein [Anaerolineales bacterium]